MDKEKIDRIFKEWKEKSLLTEDGALKKPLEECWQNNFLPFIPYFVFFVVSIICLILFGNIRPSSKSMFEFLVFLISFVWIGLSYVVKLLGEYLKERFSSSYYYYKDRLELRHFRGLWKKTYYYWTIKRIVCRDSNCTVEFRGYNQLVEDPELAYFPRTTLVDFFRTCFPDLCYVDPICYKEEYEGEIRRFANRICFKTLPECQKEALQSALTYFSKSKYISYDYKRDLSKRVRKTMSMKQRYYTDMIRLFANMICLRMGDSYQDAGYQCLLKYLSESAFRKYDYTHDLSEQIERFRGFRKKGSVPSKDGFVNISLSIMENKGLDYADRLELLTHLFECAYASDGLVDEEELNRLSRIAFYLCIKDWDFLSLRYRFETEKQSRERRNGEENARQRERCQFSYSSRKREAYNLLGLKLDAPLEEVKTAYRTQVKSCHPDTLPPTATIKEREEASQRFRTITEAYDFLCAELSKEPVSVAR